MHQSLSILGSTGSIGTQALEVRSFEPRVAENHTSVCIEESHRIIFNRWLSLFT